MSDKTPIKAYLDLRQIKDALKEFNLADNYYIGKLDNKKEKSLGIYQRQASIRKTLVGSEKNHSVKQITLLVHWTNNSVESELNARRIYTLLEQLENIKINDLRISMIEYKANEPISVDTDKNGIYEFVIDIDIWYKEEN